MILPPLAGVTQKPYVRSWTKAFNSTTPLTLTLPVDRKNRSLVIAIMSNTGGTDAPAIPSGWTGLGGDFAAAPLPGMRTAYKWLDGSEALTITSAAVGATSMSGIVLLIEGALPSLNPQTSGSVSGTSTAPDASTLSPTGQKGNILWIPFYVTGEAAHTITQYPIGFVNNTLRQQNNASSVVVMSKNQAIHTLDPSAWTLSASVSWRSAHLAVMGG